MPRLPDGWGAMHPVGEPVGPFVPIKVPLDRKFDACFQHSPEKRLDIQELITRLNLGGSGEVPQADAPAYRDLPESPLAGGDCALPPPQGSSAGEQSECASLPPGESAEFGATALPPAVTEEAAANGKIAAVFDLTNTNKYYDRDLVTTLGVEHVKLMGIAGHGSLPSEGHVLAFIKHVKRVLSDSPDAKLIVHCTHGHNRTGYMICSYLIREKLVHPREAISMFAKARPPGIYKAAYIDALYHFGGCFDPVPERGALSIFYPPSTRVHDDEMRDRAVCDLQTGEFDPEKYERVRRMMNNAKQDVFASEEDEGQKVECTTQPLPSMQCSAMVVAFRGHFGSVDMSHGQWFAVPHPTDPAAPPAYRYPLLAEEVVSDPIFASVPDPTNLHISSDSLGGGALVPGGLVTFSLRVLNNRPQVTGLGGPGFVAGGGPSAKGKGGKGKGGSRGGGRGRGRDGDGDGDGGGRGAARNKRKRVE